MKLPIEEWLEDQEISPESEVAFNESILCYKAGAYRAALMFSYIGMGLCLRRRLLSASCPSGVALHRWTEIQTSLNDESKWDPKVFECTQMRSPVDVFYVDEQLRHEMKYWKDRRNDCAHFKNNDIGAPHVEVFWLYLRSNLGRWVPKGSMKDVLDRIVRHYDPNLTPIGKNIDPIVTMIPQAVPSDEIGEFFNELVTLFTHRSAHPPKTWVDAKGIVELIDAIYTLPNRNIYDAISTWLYEQHELLLLVLRKSPIRAVILNNKHELVRNLWREMLFKDGHSDIPLFASLLRNGLISDEQTNEAVSWVVDRVTGDAPSETDDQTLNGVEFWEVLRERAIEDEEISTFNWANPKAKIITWLIERDAIDQSTASTICGVFNQPHYPYEVCAALKEMLANNPSKLAELQARAMEENRTVPGRLL